MGSPPLSKEIWLLMVSNPCEYCGDIDIKENKELQQSVKINGIDRIDSSKGYLENNCNSCCNYCNTMKLNKSKIEFFNQIIKIFKKNNLSI